MAIFTSYYAGQIRGEAVSISLSPPKGWKKQHSKVFAPTPELLWWWKSSAQDAAAQSEYRQQFSEILQSRHQLIQLWVDRQRRNPQDITLLCYEKPTDFCHRHQVGEEVIQKYLPEFWGGEVGLLGDAYINKDIGTTDTPTTITSTSFAVSPDSTAKGLRTSQQPTTINPTFPPTVQMLLSKCHDAGLLVKCDRQNNSQFAIRNSQLIRLVDFLLNFRVDTTSNKLNNALQAFASSVEKVKAVNNLCQCLFYQ